VTDRLDLAALLSDPAGAQDVAAEAVQALLDALAQHEGRCRLLRDLLTARLSARVPSAHREEDDHVADVREAASIARRSLSWMRKRGHTLPGFRQPGGKGTKVAWSRRALETWTSSPT